ncbi:MAG: hypothetical protein ACRDWY_04985, partial [Actinomycetes bacterium]
MRPENAAVTARSPRVALVLPTGAEHQEVTGGPVAVLERALEWMGRMWGGRYMLAVPDDGLHDGRDGTPPVFRRLLQVYDPDLVLPWRPTLGALAAHDEAAAHDLMAARAAQRGAVPTNPDLQLTRGPDVSDLVPELADPFSVQAVTTYVGTTDTDSTDADSTDADSTDADSGGADQPAADPSSSATAPVPPTPGRPPLPAFPEPPGVPRHAHHHQTEPPAPLATLAALTVHPSYGALARPQPPLSAGEGLQHFLARQILNLDLTSFDAWTRMITKIRLGVTGRAAGDATLDLPGEQVGTDEVDPHDIGLLLTVAMTGSVYRSDPPSWAQTQALARTPMPRSGTGLSSLTYQFAPAPFLVVVGDSVEDACLYLCWQRLYGEEFTAWLPSSVLAFAADTADS